jgi:O-antigen ligase/tetratricopeptide (TPR) repeat protein
MNNITINNTIKNIIISGLALITLIPLYVSNSLFFPFITGKAFAFRIIVEILFTLWIVLILREKGTTVVGTDKSVAPRINLITISITVLAFIALIADLFGLNPLRSIWSNFERMEGWIMIAHLWAFFMVTSSVLTTRKNWDNFFNVVLVSGLIVAFYGLLQFFGVSPTHQGDRVDASLGNSAYMAVYMLINAFIALYLAITKFHPTRVVYTTLYTASFAFFSFILFQTATRGSMLGWVAALIVFAAFYAIFGRKEIGQSNLTRGLAGGAILLILIVGVLFYSNRDAQWIQSNKVLSRLANISISDTKTQARGFIWPMAVKGIFETPKTAIIGVGQENFNYIFNSHYNPKMYAHEQWFDRAHNVYLDWLIAGGLLGLLSYLSLYLLSFIFIFKSDLTVGQKAAFVGLLVGYGVHNVFVFDNQTSYVMFFIVLAFIKNLRTGSDCMLIRNADQKPTDDQIVLRDYLFLPIMVIVFLVSVYFINVRPILANKALINGLRSCGSSKTLSIEPFKKAVGYDLTLSNQESREQFLSCATGVINNQSISLDTKMEFYGLAKQEIEKHIADVPNDARIYILAGTFYNSIGDLKSATPLLEKAVKLSPGKQTIMYELASNYMNVGSTTEGLQIMKQAYESAPENIVAKTNYVAALISTNNEAEVIKTFPNDKEIFFDPKVINAYMFAKKYSKAIAGYQALINKDPENMEAYSPLAYAYILNGQDSLAIETLKKAGNKFPAIKAQTDAYIKQIQEGKFKNQ